MCKDDCIGRNQRIIECGGIGETRVMAKIGFDCWVFGGDIIRMKYIDEDNDFGGGDNSVIYLLSTECF